MKLLCLHTEFDAKSRFSPFRFDCVCVFMEARRAKQIDMDRGSDYLHPKAYPLEFFFNSSTTINDYLLPPVDFSFEISHSIKK